MASQLSILPTTLFAGESIVKTITGITVTGYTLVYEFNSQPTPLSVDCVEDSEEWTLTVTSAQTLEWLRGVVSYVAYHTEEETGERTAVDYGQIDLTASPLKVSQYKTALEAVESAMLSYASNPNKTINIGTIRIEYKSFEELEKLRDYYRREIARETGNGYGGGRITLVTRF